MLIIIKSIINIQIKKENNINTKDDLNEDGEYEDVDQDDNASDSQSEHQQQQNQQQEVSNLKLKNDVNDNLNGRSRSRLTKLTSNSKKQVAKILKYKMFSVIKTIKF